MVALLCSAEPIHHAGIKRLLQSRTNENADEWVSDIRLQLEQRIGFGDDVDGDLPGDARDVFLRDHVRYLYGRKRPGRRGERDNGGDLDDRIRLHSREYAEGYI